MMTNGPAAGIGGILTVDLPRPRLRLEVDSDPRYLKARHAVIEFLHARRHARQAA
jgi:nitrate/nitrite transport system ATP-binding protein